MRKYAPICLFTYNRLNETKQTIEALKKNSLANKSDLIIFSDGPKTGNDIKSIQELRSFLYSINGFNSVKLNMSKENKGLARSIIDGVTKVLNLYDSVIVVEDDLLTSSNFLQFMNQALSFYEGNSKIHSISGYTMPLRILEMINKDYYYGIRASSWGWGTWKYVWKEIDWELRDFNSFISSFKKRQDFNRGGSDMSSMLSSAFHGKISSWAIIFCFHQWKHGTVTVFPEKSKIENIGFSKTASNTKYLVPEFRTILDNSEKMNFSFDEKVKLDEKVIREFAQRFSVYVRAKNKFRYLLRCFLK